MFQSKRFSSADRRAGSRAGHMEWTLAVVALVGLVGAGVVRADDELPKAEKILDKYVEATGGKAAYAKVKNRVTKGSMEVPAQGIKASLTIYVADPGRMYTVTEVEGMGKMEKGIDGEVAWETSLMTGPQIKEGEERAMMLRSAHLDAPVQWRKLFKTAECVAVETVDDKPCYKVVLTPDEGTPETRYYDQDSGLLAKTTLTLKTPMGAIPIEVFWSDYKEVDGILLPHKTKQVLMGMQEILFVSESITHNVDLPKDRFDLPAEVQALVKERQQSAAEAGKAEPATP